ncbi:MAG: flagellar basal body rod protein FlgC [Limnochordaceae bacterium]|nr:flagellar basal body rod protein FlgC [Limnochordaceae bacterium]
MGLFDALAISASGLTAERLRLDVIATNLANVETTRTATGGPFRRREVVFAAQPPTFPVDLANSTGSSGTLAPGHPALGGVQVAAIVTDPAPFRLVYQPGHPDADVNGYVAYPNINPASEMVDMIAASRAYEANLAIFQSTKQLAARTLDLLRA